MKLLTVLMVLALVLLVALLPFWGWVGTYAYPLLLRLGHLLSTGPLTDARAAFRAAVLVGGVTCVLAFFRVAARDRVASYGFAGCGLGLVFFLLFTSTARATLEIPAQETAPRIEPGRIAPGDREAPPFPLSPGDLNADIHRYVRGAARAAARGDEETARSLLARIVPWSQKPRQFGKPAAGYQGLWRAYHAMSMPDPAQRGGGTEEVTRLTGTSRADQEHLDHERLNLLAQIWAASPSSGVLALQMLAEELKSLAPARPRPRDGSVDYAAGSALEHRLRHVHTLQEALLAYAPSQHNLWRAYAATVVDRDEELALGSLVIAAMLVDAERQLPRDSRPPDHDLVFLSSEVALQAALASRASRTRHDILAARAAVLLDEPPERKSTFTPDEPLTPRHTDLARQTMPPAGLLIERAGLAIRSASAEPPGPPDPALGYVLIDLATAGFRPGPTGITLPAPGIAAEVQTNLAVDVWEDGTVTAVLVERSSGIEALDQAARAGARVWQSAATVPTGGERRRVAVRFKAPMKQRDAVADEDG